MKFYNLKEKKEHIPKVAKWFHNEWAHLNPSRTYDDVIKLIMETLEGSENKIFILVDHGKPISSISLRVKEVDTEPMHSPWLSSLVVDKKHRKKGYGASTISFFEEYCKSENIHEIFLFTEDLSSWYKKLGWSPLQEASFKDHDGLVMGRTL